MHEIIAIYASLERVSCIYILFHFLILCGEKENERFVEFYVSHIYFFIKRWIFGKRKEKKKLVTYPQQRPGRHMAPSDVLLRCDPNTTGCRNPCPILGYSSNGKWKVRLWTSWPELRSSHRNYWKSTGRSQWQGWRPPDTVKLRSLASGRRITPPFLVCKPGRLWN